MSKQQIIQALRMAYLAGYCSHNPTPGQIDKELQKIWEHITKQEETK